MLDLLLIIVRWLADCSFGTASAASAESIVWLPVRADFGPRRAQVFPARFPRRRMDDDAA